MYINKLHLWTSRPKQCWEVLCNSNLVSQLGKGPGHHVCSMVSLQNCSLGAPTYNPRPQTDTIICLPVNCSTGLCSSFLQCCLFCFANLGTLVNPQPWLARPPPRAPQLQVLPPVLSVVLLVPHSQQAWSQGSIQRGQKQGQRPPLLSCL